MRVPTDVVLITVGLHVPLIPLFEVTGNDGGVEFRQSGPSWVNVGVILDGVTAILKTAVVAHCPASGVKV